MANLLLQIIPLSIAGAINPVGTLIIILILTGEKPIKKSLFFLLGSVLFLLVMIPIGYFLIHYSINSQNSHSVISAIIDLVFGILLILLAIFRKERKSTNHQEISVFKEFIFGFLFMLLNFDGLIVYFVILKNVFESNLSFILDFVILMISIIIIMSSIFLPVLLAIIMPQKSKIVLEKLKNFMTKHGQVISKIVVLIIAIYLIIKGFKILY